MRLISNKKVALVAIALGAVTMVLPQVASGSHVRPKGASPLKDSLVLAYRPCNVPNSTHGAPLAFPSCDPPQPASKFLTAGTPDNNGAAANFIGRVTLQVVAGNVNVYVQMSDVRCLPGNPSPFCAAAGSANTAGGPDYTGETQLVAGFQLTDHYNDPTTSFTTAGTTNIVPLKVKVPCGPVTPTNIGAPCSVATNVNAVWGAGAVINAKRMAFELPQTAAGGGIQVFDGGPSSTAGDPSATLYAEPGVFLP